MCPSAQFLSDIMAWLSYLDIGECHLVLGVLTEMAQVNFKSQICSLAGCFVERPKNLDRLIPGAKAGNQKDKLA